MSDCFCDYDYPEFYSKVERKARKLHACYECGARIAVGDTYEYVAAKSEGSIWDARTCAKCVSLRAYVAAHVPCFCWAHGNMIEDAKETVREYAHECPGLFMGFGRLLIAAKNQPKRMIS